jgi:hypothetical protein
LLFQAFSQIKNDIDQKDKTLGQTVKENTSSSNLEQEIKAKISGSKLDLDKTKHKIKILKNTCPDQNLIHIKMLSHNKCQVKNDID